MTTPATPSGKPAGDDRNLVPVDENYVAPTFEDRLHTFWEKNRGAIIVFCVVVAVGILAKGIWERMQAGKDRDIQSEYAAASAPEKLKAFALAHPQHPLAGAAQLRLADDAYTAGKSADAISGYQWVTANVKGTPLTARAQLGVAMAQLQAGKNSEGEAGLKALLNDANQLKGVRTEAGFQLASVAAAAGRTDDVNKISDQLMTIDPSSPWAQRSISLRAMLPAPALATPAVVAPVAPADAPKTEATPGGIQIKVPGK